eukprot:1158645-Pelagomonas_calceolata.AAC.3
MSKGGYALLRLERERHGLWPFFNAGNIAYMLGWGQWMAAGYSLYPIHQTQKSSPSNLWAFKGAHATFRDILIKPAKNTASRKG